MGNIEKYYENTEEALPHKNVQKFIGMKTKVGNAIDLGCGMGRDTIFLIKNNWNVTAIDREDTKDIIKKRLDQDELKRFKFSCQNFEDIKLEKNDLVISNFSIPYCNKDFFDEFWKKIVESININGYFVGNFWGINDSWSNIKNKMIFLSKEQVMELFEDFNVIDFQENEYDGKTGLGKIKHWHTYNIIAKKVIKGGTI